MKRIRKQFKLVPSRDDDIIAWIESLPKGRREPTILAALRAYMSADQTRLERMERNIESLSRQLSQISEALRNGVKVNHADAPVEPESAFVKERRGYLSQAEW